AFARVFLARQGELASRLVALKVSPAFFHDESQALAQLQHTNIVPIYSVHRTSLFVVVCMPYFGSTTLAQVLRELPFPKPLPLSGNDLGSPLTNGPPNVATVISGLPPSSAPAEAPGDLAPDQQPGLAQGGAPPRSSQALQKLRQMSYVEAVLWIASGLTEG